MFSSSGLLCEYGARSTGASDPPQETAPPAGDNCDLQHIPGPALRPSLPSHTVNEFMMFSSMTLEVSRLTSNGFSFPFP